MTVTGGTAHVARTVFRRNRAEVSGGALQVDGGGVELSSETRFVQNKAPRGASLCATSANQTCERCTRDCLASDPMRWFKTAGNSTVATSATSCPHLWPTTFTSPMAAIERSSPRAASTSITPLDVPPVSSVRRLPAVTSRARSVLICVQWGSTAALRPAFPPRAALEHTARLAVQRLSSAPRGPWVHGATSRVQPSAIRAHRGPAALPEARLLSLARPAGMLHIREARRA